MDSAKQQLVDKLKTATNILVTVSRDPSVDQLAACIGLTLLLNKLNKHSVAVFSGKVPSTIEFLKPDETLQKTTDSLRDFIIALDKNKADKLRYKVENNVVRIFITPYKTSISEKDLEFSEGDFNVDVVVALGVQKQQDLDGAIMAHGRILHDAAVASINIGAEGGLGSINWHDPQASSLSELVTELVPMVGENLLDTQIATALLTGIVAETNRFSNNKTSPQTMSASSTLMAAGANQQLVATKLEQSAKAAEQNDPEQESAISDEGTLSINHKADKHQPKPPQEHKKPEPPPKPPAKPPAPPHMPNNLSEGAKLVTEPPKLGGELSANTKPEGLDPVTDPLSLPNSEPSQLLNRPAPTPPQAPPPAPTPSFTPPPTNWQPPTPPQSAKPSLPVAPSNANPASETLTDIEKAVNSPHLNVSDLGSARDEVSKALENSVDPTPKPIKALNAQPLSDDLHKNGVQPVADSPLLPFDPNSPESSITNPTSPPPSDSLSPSPGINDPKAPPVPPPIPFQFGNNQTPPNQPPPAQ
jgi:hypothetical protein